MLEWLRVLLTPLRILIILVLAIGVPLFIYLGFCAKEPVFEPAQDVELGKQTVEAIAADPEQYPLLSAEEYPEAYAHLNRIVDQLMASPEIQYRDLFAYDRVRIIHDDDVLNAFCTPGGYIYVFTGLIQYLDAEDHLAGVLGHEIAHAENRHSSLRLPEGVRRTQAARVHAADQTDGHRQRRGGGVDPQAADDARLQPGAGGAIRRALGDVSRQHRLRVRRHGRLLQEAARRRAGRQHPGVPQRSPGLGGARARHRGQGPGARLQHDAGRLVAMRDFQASLPEPQNKDETEQ